MNGCILQFTSDSPFHWLFWGHISLPLYCVPERPYCEVNSLSFMEYIAAITFKHNTSSAMESNGYAWFFCCTFQIHNVYISTYETCGQYWPYIHHYIVIAIVIMQITMIGFFGLKSKPAASFATIPLLVFTLLFNEYCKIRFFPTFCHWSVKV